MNGGRRNRRWQKGGYTLNGPKRHEITTVRSPERKKASGIGGDIGKKHTKHTQRHYITTVRQPERKEAAGIGGDRSRKAYKAHLEQKTYCTTNRWPPRAGQAGPMVVGESRHMLTYAKTKSKAGSNVDGLWTAKSGHAEKP